MDAVVTASLSPKLSKSPQQREADELGNAIERMLGL